MTYQVSIVIPTYNRSEFVIKAIESCLAVDQLTTEIIIIDDGSTDDTHNKLLENFGMHLISHKIGNHTLKWITQPNRGACCARNYGMSQSNGRYLKFLDSDDWLISNSLCYEFNFAEETGADVVVTGWQSIRYSKDGTTIFKSFPSPVLDNGIDDMLLGKAPITSAALYRSAFLKENGLQWNPDCKKAQEWEWIWTVCLAGATFKSLDIESYVHDNGKHQRIGNLDNAYLLSVLERQRILRMVETKLREKNLLTEYRKKLLSQYYYKDRISLYEIDSQKLKKMLEHCSELSSQLPDESILPIKLLNLYLPHYNSIVLYQGVKNILKRFFCN